LSAARDSGLSGASSPPLARSESVASTPGPPAFVRIANFGPSGRGCLLSTSAIWNRSEIEFTRRTPIRRNAASSTSSLPVSAPVCDAAAFEAASERPAFSTITGFVRDTSRAADRNDRAPPTDSM
jgi:hypothetical protein